MSKGLVIILMGSKGDEAHGRKIAEGLKRFSLDWVLRVASAHKTPEHARAILGEYDLEPRPKVYITVAGRSNALSGFVDGAVTGPVIACPPPAEAFGGADIFSSLQMPSGIAPGVVLDPGNAALLAAKILSLNDPELRELIRVFHAEQAAKIIRDDAELNP